MKLERVEFDGGVARFISPGEQEPKLALPFRYKTVGVKRYSEHYANGHKVAEVIIVPLCRTTVKAYDTVVINGEEYTIIQLQHDNKTMPKTTVITLEQPN